MSAPQFVHAYTGWTETPAVGRIRPFHSLIAAARFTNVDMFDDTGDLAFDVGDPAKYFRRIQRAVVFGYDEDAPTGGGDRCRHGNDRLAFRRSGQIGHHFQRVFAIVPCSRAVRAFRSRGQVICVTR